MINIQWPETESYFKSSADEWVAMKWGFECMISMAFKSEGKKGSRAKFFGEIKISLHFLQHLQNVNTVIFSQHIIMEESGGAI